MTAFGQSLACQLTVEGEVHHRLQDLRTGAIQFVEEEDNRLTVLWEPVGWGEVGARGGLSRCILLLHLGGDADDVARVGHLSEEQGDYFQPLLVEEAGEDFRLTDAVLAHEHDVLGGRS